MSRLSSPLAQHVGARVADVQHPIRVPSTSIATTVVPLPRSSGSCRAASVSRAAACSIASSSVTEQVDLAEVDPAQAQVELGERGDGSGAGELPVRVSPHPVGDREQARIVQAESWFIDRRRPMSEPAAKRSVGGMWSASHLARSEPSRGGSDAPLPDLHRPRCGKRRSTGQATATLRKWFTRTARPP